jgi:uncharacterized membrane protein AbrB (regulator of aidB expression)
LDEARHGALSVVVGGVLKMYAFGQGHGARTTLVSSARADGTNRPCDT